MGEESAEKAGDDFDLDLDLGGEEDKKPAEVSEELSLDLDLGEESAEKAGDDFDLDFEEEEKSQDIEFNLDLEESEAEAEQSEEFSFELDLEETGAKPAASDEETEIFDMALDEASGAEAKPDEFDLDLEMEDSGSKPEAKTKAEVKLKQKSEEPAFDLEMESETSGVSQEKSDEFEFDLDIDSASDEADELQEQEESEGFDFGETDEASVDMASISDIETERKDDFSDAFDMGIPRDDLADISADEGLADGSGDKKPKITKIPRPTNATLVALFVATMIGGGTYYAYTKNMLPKKDDLRQLPYVGTVIDQVFGPPQSLGEIVPIEGSTSERFVENSGSGYLLVLSGKVKNEFSRNRSFVRVKGTLYGANKKMLGKPAVAYCGNILTDEELATLDIKEIQKRLSDRNGKDNANVNLTPGKVIPYMVVFSDVPDDVEEFAVEVAGSEPAEK
ncbi:MAG: DUF3426 domain-containing protein [Desulfobacterales bacterium]